MDRFAGMLETGLEQAGHQVRLIKPVPLIGRMFPSATGLGKWLGYLDRFVLFQPRLSRSLNWADVVHICDQANGVYVPWLKGKPHVVTCNDMLAIRSALGEIRENWTGLSGRIYQRWILSGLRRAMYVVCISKATREDVRRLTSLRSDNVSVILMGFNYAYRPMPREELSHHLEQVGLADCCPFLLHVGGNFWYKNRVGLLRIFSHMVRIDGGENWKLVLAGTALPENLARLARELGIYDRIREAINVTNKQLCALYSAAQGLIFPSLAEGFGWPIIEAQSCGCPVFTSNRKPMTEVGGDSAVYFDPEDEFGAAKIIRKVLKNRNLVIEAGYRNAMKYSAKAMIQGYERVYGFVGK